MTEVKITFKKNGIGAVLKSLHNFESMDENKIIGAAELEPILHKFVSDINGLMPDAQADFKDCSCSITTDIDSKNIYSFKLTRKE